MLASSTHLRFWFATRAFIFPLQILPLPSLPITTSNPRFQSLSPIIAPKTSLLSSSITRYAGRACSIVLSLKFVHRRGKPYVLVWKMKNSKVGLAALPTRSCRKNAQTTLFNGLLRLCEIRRALSFIPRLPVRSVN